MRIPVELQGVLISGLTALLLEGAVRQLGYAPLQGRVEPPIMREQYELDPTRGYRMRPGAHAIRRPDGTSVVYRVSPEGERLVPGQGSADEHVLFVGDSFTFGDFVEDGDSLPAQVQRELPNLRVRNLGASGYGTCQTLLTTQAVLRTSRGHPLVVHGVNPLQADRNVASSRQLWRLAYQNAGYSTLMPRCRFGEDGRLRVDPPVIVKPFGFGLVSWSGLAVLFNEALFAARGAGEPSAEELTFNLLVELDREVRAQSGTLLLLLTDFEPAILDRYRAFIQNHDMAVLELPQTCDADPCRILHDGHPGPSLYAAWAKFITPKIRQLLGPVAMPAHSSVSLGPR